MVKGGAKGDRARNRLTRLMMSVQDFQQARSAAIFLQQEVDEDEKYHLADLRRFRCYETAMVVAYARPFSMAKGEVGRFKLADAGVLLTPAEKKLHRKILNHRNTLYAHSDAEFVEMRTYLFHTRWEGSDEGFKFLMPRFEEGMRFPLAEVREIDGLTFRLVHAAIMKTQEYRKDFGEEFPKVDIDLD